MFICILFTFQQIRVWINSPYGSPLIPMAMKKNSVVHTILQVGVFIFLAQLVLLMLAWAGWQKSLEIHARWTLGRSAMPWCNQWERTKTRGESRWRHQMEIFFVLLALCEGNPSVTAGFPSLRPVTRSFDFFYVRLNKKKTRANSLDVLCVGKLLEDDLHIRPVVSLKTQ